jgi:hypothetical protein
VVVEAREGARRRRVVRRARVGIFGRLWESGMLAGGRKEEWARLTMLELRFRGSIRVPIGDSELIGCLEEKRGQSQWSVERFN